MQVRFESSLEPPFGSIRRKRGKLSNSLYSKPRIPEYPNVVATLFGLSFALGKIVLLFESKRNGRGRNAENDWYRKQSVVEEEERASLRFVIGGATSRRHVRHVRRVRGVIKLSGFFFEASDAHRRAASRGRWKTIGGI